MLTEGCITPPDDDWPIFHSNTGAVSEGQSVTGKTQHGPKSRTRGKTVFQFISLQMLYSSDPWHSATMLRDFTDFEYTQRYHSITAEQERLDVVGERE